MSGKYRGDKLIKKGCYGMFDNEHPELQKEGRYTSPASPRPLHELKMLQEYIHGANLQNLGAVLPNRKKQLILIKFLKSKKNQVVEIYSKTGEEVIHTIGKVTTIGRDFVMIQTLFTRFWIPFAAIQTAKSPFGLPDIPGSHQQVVIDEELRRKLLTNFGEVVSGKQTLRQQFFEELLETNLKSWKGTNLTIHTSKIYNGKLKEVSAGQLLLSKQEKKIPIKNINYMKQTRFISFIQRIFSKNFFRKKSNKKRCLND